MGKSWRRPLTYVPILLALACLSLWGVLGGCAGVGLEKAKYAVLEKDGRFEVRRYEPYIVAETVVEADFDQAGNVAFGRLFDYISGRNRSRDKIAMTAPVNQRARSEKIAMTAPVSQQRSGSRYVVSFLMPSKYTMETLPEPSDPTVTLRRVPAQKMAAIRYSGSWSRKRYEAHLAKLESALVDRALEPAGEPVFARYDPPFQLPFLRRNEVLIPVR